MNYQAKIEQLETLLKIKEKREQIKEIEKKMNDPLFWSTEKNNEAVISELKDLKDEVKKFDQVRELAEIAGDEDADVITKEIEELEKIAIFSGKYDANSAILNFYAGAGGDDAQDWTEMLLSMYLKWAEKNSYKASIINKSVGGIAGVKTATVEINGRYAYGKLKHESGVHRLVRQSPFNAKNLRQTSFSYVEVLPEIEKNDVVAIDDKDLKIDVFRSSGHGGQSVNTTDSAVRITHIPTGLVVTCQNERSQLQNKENAMKVLRARIVQRLIDEHKEKIEELRGETPEPEWGSQIRSYVLHPYKLVKDHRTGHESTNPDSVLSGDINDFIDAELRMQKADIKS